MAVGIGAVKALVFDVFGTVVDWRDGIIAEGEALGRAKGLKVDWGAFADAWHAGYRPAMDRVRRGERPWANVEALHRERLEEILAEFGVEGLSEAEKEHLNGVWNRLNPWPDSVAGLGRLKGRFIVSTLTNGTFAGMIQMARRAGLPWDCVLTAENARHYKPDAEVYRMAIELLGPAPQRVMMVAAHNYDLAHARSHGMPTAFVARPREHGPGQTTDIRPEQAWDVVASDFLDLARRLGA